MEPLHVFLLQWLVSLTVYSFLAAWFAVPYLRTKPVRAALIILTVPHLIRHISAASLAPGVAVAETMPLEWAWSVTLGDHTALILALATIAALRARARYAVVLAWIFNVVGALDIMHVGYEARRYAIVDDLGAQWFIPTMAVPLLVVSHVLIFATLVRRGGELADNLAGNLADDLADRQGD